LWLWLDRCRFSLCVADGDVSSCHHPATRFTAARHPSPYLSVARQAFAIHALLPDAKVTLGANTRLAAIADLQASPVSRRYTIGIDYFHGGVPEVRVLAPELALHSGAVALPNTYPATRCAYTFPATGAPPCSLLTPQSFGPANGCSTTRFGTSQDNGMGADTAHPQLDPQAGSQTHLRSGRSLLAGLAKRLRRYFHKGMRVASAWLTLTLITQVATRCPARIHTNVDNRHIHEMQGRVGRAPRPGR
jgi:hypothetical protein